jgi:hypothetical protein
MQITHGVIIRKSNFVNLTTFQNQMGIRIAKNVLGNPIHGLPDLGAVEMQ